MSQRAKLLEQLNGGNNPIILTKAEIKQTEGRYDQAKKDYEQTITEMQLIDLVRFFRVGILGSARLTKENVAGKRNKSFQFVSDLTKALVEAKPIDIVTGGGPGIMEAANEGLTRIDKSILAKRESIAKNHGVLIKVAHEKGGNRHLHFETTHENYSTRLQEMLSKVQGAYNAPGGLGTLLEMIFIEQLRQSRHLEENFPILAHPEWEKIVNAINDELYHKRHQEGRTPTLNENDLKNIVFTDDINTIVSIFTQAYDRWKREVNSRLQIINRD